MFSGKYKHRHVHGVMQACLSWSDALLLHKLSSLSVRSLNLPSSLCALQGSFAFDTQVLTEGRALLVLQVSHCVEQAPDASPFWLYKHVLQLRRS